MGMGTRIVWLLAAALGCSGCSGDAEPTRAAAAFSSFQAALQRGDEAACRALVTGESAKALGAIDWRAVGKRKPLEVLGSERGAGDFRVKVADPNDGGRTAEFVVVREYGRYVVDLVATAGMHTEVIEAADSREEFVPQELSPRDLERIRQYELSRPVEATSRR